MNCSTEPTTVHKTKGVLVVVFQAGTLGIAVGDGGAGTPVELEVGEVVVISLVTLYTLLEPSGVYCCWEDQ